MAPRPREIHLARDMLAYSRAVRAAGEKVAFVPTMGFLHEGHLSLVDCARRAGDKVVVSIFVNPTQFGPNEDLDQYPRDLERDLSLLAERGTDIVFLPAEEEIYPFGFATSVAVRGLTDRLCGTSRPVHFGGVATVVTKLFNLIQPDVAVFGQKDYQQLQVIRRMTRDLNLPIEIVGAPTIREPDGLAMSSRNAYLSADERRAAPALFAALTAVRDTYELGERRGKKLVELATGIIEEQTCLRIDYLQLIDPEDLTYLVDGPESMLPERVHMALAVFAGSTRLIDNMRISEDQ